MRLFDVSLVAMEADYVGWRWSDDLVFHQTFLVGYHDSWAYYYQRSLSITV